MSDLLGDLPRLFPRPEQTIAGVGWLLRQGEVSCMDILNACLEQVDRWEPKVHAWVVLDRDGAIEQARALDEERQSGADRGPLHGIPIGIKDIIDVKGSPTACGSKRWVARIAGKDADVVAKLREAGAVIMGKTVTTPYAWIDPPRTRNPWNLERTPGGSSSGSAAAVACGMCYGAVGTQTGGSITRPASFCGIAGMKPSYHYSIAAGTLPFAPSLDHVGALARNVPDLRWIFGAMTEPSLILSGDREGDTPRTSPPRLVRLRGFFDRRADPSMRSMFEAALHVLADREAEIIEADDPVNFEQVLADHRRVMAAEAANVHSAWLDEFPDEYPARIKELILEGQTVRAVDYLRAKGRQLPVMFQILEALLGREANALINPATVGAPPNPSTTGDPAFNSPWTFSQLPTVSLPMGLGTDGMPLAVQLVGCFCRDYELLHTAEWCESAIRTSRR